MFPLILLIVFIPAANLPAVLPSLGYIQMVTPMRIAGGIAAGIAFLRDFSGNRFPSMHHCSFTKIFAIYVIINVLSGLYWALFRHLAGGVQEHFTRLFSFVLFYYVTMSCVRSTRNVTSVIQWSVIAMSAFSLFHVISFLKTGGGITMMGRLSGSSYDPNYFALQLLLIIPMAVGLSCWSNGFLRRLSWGVCAVVLLIAGFSTLSRAGIGIGLPVMLTSAVLVSQKKARAIRSLMMLSLVCALLVGISGPGRKLAENFLERLTRTAFIEDAELIENEAAMSTTARVYLFWAGLKMTADNPILGVGPGNFRWRANDYGSRSHFMAHNMYWSVGGETGVIALGSFMGMIFLTGVNLNRIRHLTLSGKDQRSFLMANSLLVGLISFAVAALFLHAEGEKFFWLLMFLTVAFQQALSEESANAPPNQA